MKGLSPVIFNIFIFPLFLYCPCPFVGIIAPGPGLAWWYASSDYLYIKPSNVHGNRQPKTAVEKVTEAEGLEEKSKDK